MEIMNRILMDEAFLPALASVIAAVYMAFKAWARVQWQLQDRQAQRWETALDAIEAAVLEVYEEYVRGIKQDRPDGKLTNQQRLRARQMAKEKAIDIAQERGIKLLGLVGNATMTPWIEKAVRRLKKS